MNAETAAKNLGTCIAILTDAVKGTTPALGASPRGALDDLTDAEKDALTTLGADEFKPLGIQGSALPASTPDYLIRWTQSLSHEIFR